MKIIYITIAVCFVWLIIRLIISIKRNVARKKWKALELRNEESRRVSREKSKQKALDEFHRWQDLSSAAWSAGRAKLYQQLLDTEKSLESLSREPFLNARMDKAYKILLDALKKLQAAKDAGHSVQLAVIFPLEPLGAQAQEVPEKNRETDYFHHLEEALKELSSANEMMTMDWNEFRDYFAERLNEAVGTVNFNVQDADWGPSGGFFRDIIQKADHWPRLIAKNGTWEIQYYYD